MSAETLLHSLPEADSGGRLGLFKHPLVLVAALDLALLAFQLPLEEREFGERFGVAYLRYCELVPRFVPKRRTVRQRDLHT